MIMPIADVGVPMLAIQWPVMFLTLIPVILIEFWIVCRRFQGSRKTLFWGVCAANIFSTAVGIPLAWIVMTILEMGSVDLVHFVLPRFDLPISLVPIIQSPWLPPYEDQLYWMIPCASVILLIPSFFVSTWMESVTCARMWKQQTKMDVRAALWSANLASYAFLFIVGTGWLLWSILFLKGT